VHYIVRFIVGYALIIQGLSLGQALDPGQIESLGNAIRRNFFVPDPVPALEAVTHRRFAPAQGVRAEAVSFQTQFGTRIPAVLYLPETSTGRIPAFVVVNGHGGDKHSWYSYYTGILYARAGAAVLTYDPAGEAERHAQRKSGTRSHDRIKGDPLLARHLAGLMITDIMQAVSYLCSRPEVDATRIGAGGYSMGSFILALTGAVEPRLKACVLVGGGNLDGPGGYWDRSKKMCQGYPYQSLSFLGDRGATIYALHAARGPTLIYNGLDDSVVGISERSPAFFADLRARTIKRNGSADGVFEFGFLEEASHRPYFVTRPVARWLERHLDLPHWTQASLAAMPTCRIADWATQHDIAMDRLYATDEREGGTPALGYDIPGYRHDDLRVFSEVEWTRQRHAFDFQTWLTQARKQAGAQRRRQTAATQLRLYPVSVEDHSDGQVSGTINGRQARFVYFRNFPTYYYDTNYCRLAADGPVCVDLTIRPEFKEALLRGLLSDIPYARDGQKLSFILPGPGHYYLQLPDVLAPEAGKRDSGTYTVAFWIDELRALDAGAMDPHAPDVTVITHAGIENDPAKDQTASLQALLDRGGRFYFPAGVYRSGTLNLRSHTTLYFAPGAMLKGTDQRDAIGKRLIYIKDAEHVTLYGPGTLDANYDGFPRDTPNIHIVDVDHCRHISFADLCLRNCNSWALHLAASQHLSCRDLRILSGKDGIDPDSSQDVLIEDSYIQSKDDAIAIKARVPPHTTERVTVRRCIVASDASALKVGTETRALMRDILFEDCDVFDSDRGLILYARDGGPIENLCWRNIRLFMIHWPHETGGTPLQFFVTKRDGLTPVRQLRVENIRANMIVPCGFAGLAEAPLDDLVLKDIHLRVERPAHKGSYFRGNRDGFEPALGEAPGPRPALLKVGDHVDIRFDGLTIDWQGNRARWGGLLSEGAKGVAIRNLIEKP